MRKISHLYSRIFVALICVLALNSNELIAQSNHYWSQNFNTESSLLAGAVVGGNAGPSAVYYNPALISPDESYNLALSANLLSFQLMKMENLAGSGTELDDYIFQVQPKFLSYIGASKKNPNITYEFAFLVPLTKNIKFSYLYYDKLNIIDRLDGNEDYIGEINYINQYDDYYVGGGVSYKLSDQFTIGASMFVSYKVLNYQSTIAMKAMQDTDTIYSHGIPEPFYFAQSTFSERMKYWDYSLLLKIGAHYRSPNGNWGIGLNISLPNLSIYGEGDVKKEYYRSKVFNDSIGQFTKNLAFICQQENVRTKVKDPFSVAIGLQYKMPNRKNSIMLSAQYFLTINHYALLKTTDSEVIGNIQVANVAETMTYYTSANAVFNVGFGFVQYINDQVTINGGFKTDFNAKEGEKQKVLDEISSRTVKSDLYFNKFHIIVGPRLDVKKFGLVLGIQYTWGRKSELFNFANFSNPVEYNQLTNRSLQGVRQNNMKISYNEISLFFGITYGLGK